MQPCGLPEYLLNALFIDESTNQEPPSIQSVLDTITSTSTFITTKGLQDTLSTASSGYFSTASQSSQQQCLSQCVGKKTSTEENRELLLSEQQPISSLIKRRGFNHLQECPCESPLRKRPRVATDNSAIPQLTSSPITDNCEVELSLDDTMSISEGGATSSPIKSQESGVLQSSRYDIAPISRCVSVPASISHDRVS